MLLTQELFSTVIKSAPLISIDLIIENKSKEVLLGKRINEPAKGFWFVPGGRVFKNESLDDAFKRTVQAEIGHEMRRESSSFLGVYEHFYANNVFDNAFGTHYVVLAHKIFIDEPIVLNDQHAQYHWFNVNTLLEQDDVHMYTKEYFKGNK